MLLPLQAIIVPHYMAASFLRLSPYLSIVLPAVFNPLGTIILFQFCRAVPAELVEAAKIDGAGHISIFFHIILPLMKNGIITLAVLLSVEYWNIIDQAVVFIDSVYDQPLSVYLVEIAKDNMALIFASSVIFMLPMLLIYNSFKDNFSKGIQMSAGIR
jgi:multiple sugar transport system permease protein